MTANLDLTLRQRVFDTVRLILPRVLGREIPEIADSTELRGDLGMRSATTLEVLLELDADQPVRYRAERLADLGMRVRGHQGPAPRRQLERNPGRS